MVIILNDLETSCQNFALFYMHYQTNKTVFQAPKRDYSQSCLVDRFSKSLDIYYVKHVIMKYMLLCLYFVRLG